MVFRFTIHALWSALLLSGAASALCPGGMVGGECKHLGQIAQEKFDQGTDGVDLRSAQRVADAANSTVHKEFAELPLDHFSDCSDTFQNRYWVQEKFYRPGGPVFVFDGGESNAQYDVGWLESGFFKRMLEKFGGMGLLWEHRYYGASIPTPMDYTYLSTEQALADLPAMAANFSRPRFSGVDLTPAGTPWIFVGGSYPGIRAALSRQGYPETFHAAWAASAPVQARVDMSVYFAPMIPGMKDYGYDDCLADIQAANGRMNHLLADPTSSIALKQKFYSHGANMSNGEFAENHASLWYGWQSGGARSMTSLCRFLEHDAKTNSSAPDGGWAPVRGADWVIDHLSHFSAFSGGQVARANDGNSWTWQYCTQWGFLQGAGPELDNLVIKYDSIAYQEKYCRDTFPDYHLPTWPESKKLNEEYGGWHIRPSNVLWTGDEFDPWRTLSPLSDLPHAPEVEISREIPACGVETGASKIFGHVLSGTEHCFEFYNTPAAQDAQQLWSDALKQWLPCFEKKSPSEVAVQCPAKCSTSQMRTLRRASAPMTNAKRAVQFSA